MLGGGASFGAVQVGMLQALAEIDLCPDLVVGTSVGAINGSLVAEDPLGAAARLGDLWLQVNREMIFPGRALERLRTWRRHHTYLVASEGLRDLLTRTLSAERIEDLTIPFSATAMELVTGRPVRLESGPLVPAVLASSALPGLFPPVLVDGRELVDGGIVDNVPILRAIALGAASVVVLDCGVYGLRPDAPETLVETLAHVMAIMMRQQVVRDVPAAARRTPVLYLPGPFPMTTSPLEFQASAELIRAANDRTRGFLADLKLDGAGLYGEPPLLLADPAHVSGDAAALASRF